MFDRSTPRLISAWLPFPLGSFAPLHGDVERDKAGKMWMDVAKFDKFGRREMNCDAGECEEGWVDPFFFALLRFLCFRLVRARTRVFFVLRAERRAVGEILEKMRSGVGE